MLGIASAESEAYRYLLDGFWGCSALLAASVLTDFREKRSRMTKFPFSETRFEKTNAKHLVSRGRFAMN